MFDGQKGQGAPAREAVFSEEEKKKMMAYAYRKQEELKVSDAAATLLYIRHYFCQWSLKSATL